MTRMKFLIDLISEQLAGAFERAGFDAAYGKATLSNRPDLCESVSYTHLRPTHSSFSPQYAALTAVLLTCTLETESLFPRPFPVFSRFNPQ